MKKKARRTKQSDVLKYLQTHKRGLTQAMATDMFHTDRLSDIILKLRRKGYDIITIQEEGKDPYGKNTYGRYFLRKSA